MLKKPSILACLGIYCSVLMDFALFAWSCVCFSSFAEGLMSSGLGKHPSSGGVAARVLTGWVSPLGGKAVELASC